MAGVQRTFENHTSHNRRQFQHAAAESSSRGLLATVKKRALDTCSTMLYLFHLCTAVCCTISMVWIEEVLTHCSNHCIFLKYITIYILENESLGK